MMGGFLEDILALGIIAKFKGNPSENQLAELFTGYGPLASLSSKTALGYLLGVLGRDSKHDLVIIRKIRNDFAHVIEPIDFNTKVIADRCRSLKLKAKLSPSFEERVGKGARAAFLLSGIQVFAHLLLNSQLIVEENALLAKHQSELRKKAMATMKTSMGGKMPVTFP